MAEIITFIKEHLLEIISIFLGGSLTVGAITFFKNKNSNKVKQKNNFVGGDMAGRDIKK